MSADKQRWSVEAARRVTQRIIVEGDLYLHSPAHFGGGDSSDDIDMLLLRDSCDDACPLLTGASIAGALRSYLRQREHGYGCEEVWDKTHQNRVKTSASVVLFGGSHADDKGEQSPLIVEDAFGIQTENVEIREGVRLDAHSRTAAHNALFNIETWPAGTVFPLRFELLVREAPEEKPCSPPSEATLRQALATALEGLQQGEITLGARKRRGYGEVTAGNWRVAIYDLGDPEQLLTWITAGDQALTGLASEDIRGALNVTTALPDGRSVFRLEATLSVCGSLLIRSEAGTHSAVADMTHLHGRHGFDQIDRQSPDVPLLSGTTLAGGLRARACKIAVTLAGENYRDTALPVVADMFGTEPKPSRIRTWESEIKAPQLDGNQETWVQNRVSIDRFTGGGLEGALFNQQPTFASQETTVTIHVELANPEPYEIGLLLLLLKDLWTQDLPLGGESSVGRGRLQGRKAILNLHWSPTLQSGQVKTRWHLEEQGKLLSVSQYQWNDASADWMQTDTGAESRRKLEEFVDKLGEHLQSVKNGLPLAPQSKKDGEPTP